MGLREIETVEGSGGGDETADLGNSAAASMINPPPMAKPSRIVLLESIPVSLEAKATALRMSRTCSSMITLLRGLPLSPVSTVVEGEAGISDLRKDPGETCRMDQLQAEKS
jgi:hypothetical protein